MSSPLAPERRPLTPRDRQPGPSSAYTRSRWTAFLAAGLAALWACGAPGAPPEALYGTWLSEHPAYEDRAMTISADSVWFTGAQGRRSAYPVRGARAEENDVSITYGKGRRVYELRLRMRPDGSLVLQNRAQVIWHRRGPGSTAGA